MTTAMTKRIDIISDTHGHLSDQLLAALEGADLIVHAGDLTSESDYFELRAIAPMRAVLGKQRLVLRLRPRGEKTARFTYEGLTFGVAHYQRGTCRSTASDVAVCGHTQPVPRS